MSQTRRFFEQMHFHALSDDQAIVNYVCVSEASRNVVWRSWKDWEWWGKRGLEDGPIHDNKNFVTRYSNGATVEFRVAT